MLEIKNISVNVADNGVEILHNINLNIKDSEIHFLLGKNGSGKSSLAMSLVGNEKYKISSGSVLINGEDLLKMSIEERVHKGLFLSYQNPISIDGLSFSVFLKYAVNSVRRGRGLNPLNAYNFFKLLEKYCDMLSIPNDWIKRDVNVGFSGGEKKKMEMLQMLLLEPKYAILDEPDSGVDVDAIKSVISAVNFCKTNLQTSFIIISHYDKLLTLNPDSVHILSNGCIIKTGGVEIAKQIQENGFDNL